MDTKKVLDIEAAAEYLVALGFTGATTWTIRGLIANGELRATKLVRKHFVSREDLDLYVERAFGRSAFGAVTGRAANIARKAR